MDSKGKERSLERNERNEAKIPNSALRTLQHGRGGSFRDGCTVLSDTLLSLLTRRQGLQKLELGLGDGGPPGMMCDGVAGFQIRMGENGQVVIEPACGQGLSEARKCQ